MLTILDAQMEMFRAIATRRFEDRCLALVRDGWGEEYGSWSESRLREELRELFTAGRSWNFRSERNLYRLVNLACLLGLNFQRYGAASWATTILAAPDVDVDCKVQAVLDRFADESRNIHDAY